MLFLVPVKREGELADDQPGPWEVVIPDIPMGTPHNRFISLETGRRCAHARVEDRKFYLIYLNTLAGSFAKRFPGLPERMVEFLIVNSTGLPEQVGKYKGTYRVLVTDTEATLIGVEDDAVMHQLWADFNPATYTNG